MPKFLYFNSFGLIHGTATLFTDFTIRYFGIRSESASGAELQMVFANGGGKVIFMGKKAANVSWCSDNYNDIRQRKLWHVYGQKNLRDEKKRKE